MFTILSVIIVLCSEILFFLGHVYICNKYSQSFPKVMNHFPKLIICTFRNITK